MFEPYVIKHKISAAFVVACGKVFDLCSIVFSCTAANCVDEAA
jgi:hypothetical protein